MTIETEIVLDKLYNSVEYTKSFKIKLINSKNISYLDSKIGGTFYWPDYETIQDYQFLAQINFEDLPKNKIFPSEGLLQFFIGNDDAYGLFDNKCLVVYHKKILNTGKEVSIQHKDSPIIKPCKMKFKLIDEPLSAFDYRFNKYFDESKYSNDIIETVYDDFNGMGNKLLGYPFFTQYDPRDTKTKYNTLLFQLDSDNKNIMWGDFGVGNFFINNKDLENLNFSDVYFTWDCY